MDSKDMLDKRLVRAAKTDTMLGMVLEGTLNHLVTAYGDAIVTPIRKQVMGGDKMIRSFFWYPVTSFLRVARTLLDDRRLGLSCDELMSGCGEHAFSALLESPVGKMLGMFGKGNPQALVSNGPYAYTLAVSFGERVYTRKSNTSADVVFTGDLLGPSFTIAVYKVAFKLVSSVDATVTATVTNDDGSDFIIHSRW
ncbi:TIGR02265 family protein [Polyangium spumosum]|nr:TIGR02265 family protein [Polyangium spumosum]